MSTAPDRTIVSVISKACSPLSGWEIYKLSMSTPILFAYTGSKACSASMNPAMPPLFCTSAIICSVTVVLPLLSGPYISTILPFGIPPSPRAISKLKEPVGTVSTFIFFPESPNFITDPFPYCFSIWDRATSSAFNLSSFSIETYLLLIVIKNCVFSCTPRVDEPGTFFLFIFLQTYVLFVYLS